MRLHFHKYGKIEDECQYCIICGKARTLECAHKWETIEVHSVTKGNSTILIGHRYILRCKNCGDIDWRNIYTP